LPELPLESIAITLPLAVAFIIVARKLWRSLACGAVVVRRSHEAGSLWFFSPKVVHYWKTSNNIEVDFVLYGDRGLKIFEVKRKGKIPGSDLRGLKAFLNDYPYAKAYLIYGGKRQMSDGSINILPLEYAIKNLEVIL